MGTLQYRVRVPLPNGKAGWWNAEHQSYLTSPREATPYSKEEAEARAKEHGGVAVIVPTPRKIRY